MLIRAELTFVEAVGEEQREREAQTLRQSLLEVEVVKVEFGRVAPGAGAKAAGALDVAHLVILVAPVPALITAVTAICVARIRADSIRSIHLRSGDEELRLEGLSSEEQRELTRRWVATLSHSDGHDE